MEKDGYMKRRKGNPPNPSRHPRLHFSDSQTVVTLVFITFS